ncbi:metallophosphoesterase family protein [Natronorubrum tibetense]|uniref:Metallophosphoesterase n=1 Tax=Natronorubrum tibetense GA33 TaxID=1114856 RepID=L9VRL2_9EURY|nr:metallophosphoesterase [Natronorubrum tibetense]ELY39804.1 metallophosphoesterase [Natronorubrum tibetense GA33]
MVRLLLLGDLHLSATGPTTPPECPNIESLDVDAIVSIGDIIDDNTDHAGDETAGSAYERRGRAFFEQLNEVGVPVITVPGNHDPVDCTRRLANGLDNVIVAHRCAVDDLIRKQPTLEAVRFVGWGCKQFDLTPTFAYDQYPGIVPELTEVKSVTQTAAQTANAVEAIVGRFLAGRLDSREAAVELGVSADRQQKCAGELTELAEEFDEIRELLTNKGETTILLSHESPFHVDFDHHHSSEALRGRLHRGSIPLKMAIAASAPDVVFSGHMHAEGRDVIETTGGYADIYNPGSPGVSFVEIETETGSLTRVV